MVIINTLHTVLSLMCQIFVIWAYLTRKHVHIEGLAQDCSNSIANALELLQSCTKPSLWCLTVKDIMSEPRKMNGTARSHCNTVCYNMILDTARQFLRQNTNQNLHYSHPITLTQGWHYAASCSSILEKIDYVIMEPHSSRKTCSKGQSTE